ncbi:MAG: hypothetical protein KAI41_09735, partial [Hyphomicrobiaceae bacterium]|nr:hypothetical protein [Hyphomicrobiaceae bacterium]
SADRCRSVRNRMLFQPLAPRNVRRTSATSASDPDRTSGAADQSQRQGDQQRMRAYEENPASDKAASDTRRQCRALFQCR